MSVSGQAGSPRPTPGREVLCGCSQRCGDDGDIDGPGTCKGLPQPPLEPLVVIRLIHRSESEPPHAS
jgi:hypothetical protein